jgi:hypothetical protein
MTTEPGPAGSAAGSAAADVGPVEWVALMLPGERVPAEVVASLAALVDAGTVRLIDAAVVRKDDTGAVTAVEVEDLPDPDRAAVADLDGDVLGLLGADDLTDIGDGLSAGAVALVLVWENAWAARFAAAVRAAGGVVVAHDRVPREALDRAFAETALTAGGAG